MSAPTFCPNLPTNIKRNVGLYRDDGLGAFSTTPKEIENIKKVTCKTFNDHKLKLTIDVNKKSVNFLDVSFDLRSRAYKPYTKPNSVPLYVHRDSNHLPLVLRQIPKSINCWLSNISSCQQMFDSTRQPYQEALLKSGYDYQLHFDPQPTQEKRSRKRNVIWFNPPYSANVATNIGRKFLKAIDECFPKGHPLHKICNSNTLKLSYRCMPNVANIISLHNKSVLNKTKETADHTSPENKCNCRIKNNCLLKGKCQTKGIVYQATVTNEDNNTKETYVGLTEGTFKTRYRNHTSSFRNEKSKNATELSKHVWSLKESIVHYSTEWKIMKKCHPYSNRTNCCNLCIYKKFLIICHPELSPLNKRNELISTCRHQKKHLLCNK